MTGAQMLAPQPYMMCVKGSAPELERGPQGSPGLFAGQELSRANANSLKKGGRFHFYNVQPAARIVKRRRTDGVKRHPASRMSFFHLFGNVEITFRRARRDKGLRDSGGILSRRMSQDDPTNAISARLCLEEPPMRNICVRSAFSAARRISRSIFSERRLGALSSTVPSRFSIRSR